MIKPASIPVIRESGGIWHIRQDFYRLGAIAYVSAWGFSRRDALRNFEGAKIEADYSQQDPFKALCEILWATAGIIDNITRSLK